jgi:chloramphenicol O-acetyltransferase type A
MNYRVVDDYYRREHFDFFQTYESPFYSINFDLDITAAKQFSSDRGHSVYLTLCYLFARGMNRVEDFRYRLLNDEIVILDQLEIAATVPAPNGAFSFARFDDDPELESFLRRAEPVAQHASE